MESIFAQIDANCRDKVVSCIVAHEMFSSCFAVIRTCYFAPRGARPVHPITLKIPYGNKEVALKLGARYGSAGWYAPPGVDLAAFSERGWL
jgi:hypothetical protein